MNPSPTRSSIESGALPKPILIGAALLVGFSLSISTVARLRDVGTVHMPMAQAVEALSLRFEDQDTGAIAVRDTRADRVIYVVQPGADVFIRATMRGLAQERRRSGLSDQTPFVLTRWNDGTLSLFDAPTQRTVNLDAFGKTNAQAFANIFIAGRRTP